jgi:hypothetical protein
MDVKVSSRIDGETEKLSASDRRRQIKKINEEYRTQMDQACGNRSRKASRTFSSGKRFRSMW